MKKAPLRSSWSIALLAAAACVVSGCSGLLGNTVDKTESLATPFSESSTLAANTVNGTISVERTSEPLLEVEATIRATTEERLLATQLVINQVGLGAYEVSIAWPDGERLRREGADVKIRVPGASALDLSTLNGTVRVEGLDSAIKATTTNGNVTVKGPARSIDITTTNGDIELEAIAGEALARTTNGSINAAMTTDNPGPVNLTSTNGGIVLRVGPSFAGSMSVRTSNGQITLGDFQPADAPTALKSDRGTAAFDFGTTDHQSRLQTTNGNVRINPI